MSKIKKYLLNRNFAIYNFSSGVYEAKDGTTMLSHEETLRNKWKCEKCSESYSSYKNLLDHKQQNHSY
jgi:hypothetical protein